MAAKSEKNTGGKSTPKPSKETPKKTSSKSKKELEDNDEDDEDLDDDTVSPKSGVKNAAKTSGKKGKGEDDDDDDDADDVDVVDDWDKPEEEEEWDPDFEEFDLPKSKVKKTGGVKKGKGDDDELGIDEEFKDLDLFNDRGLDDEEDDF